MAQRITGKPTKAARKIFCEALVGEPVPQDLAAEGKVLAAAATDTAAYSYVMSTLKADDFFDDDYRNRFAKFQRAWGGPDVSKLKPSESVCEMCIALRQLTAIRAARSLVWELVLGAYEQPPGTWAEAAIDRLVQFHEGLGEDLKR